MHNPYIDADGVTVEEGWETLPTTTEAPEENPGHVIQAAEAEHAAALAADKAEQKPGAVELEQVSTEPEKPAAAGQ
jgi:hypothetical protein